MDVSITLTTTTNQRADGRAAIASSLERGSSLLVPGSRRAIPSASQQNADEDAALQEEYDDRTTAIATLTKI